MEMGSPAICDQGLASQEPVAHEQEELLRSESTPKTGTCRGMRFAIAGAVLCGIVGALVLKRALTPCIPGVTVGRGAQESLVSLMEEEDTEDLVNLAANDGSDDDALRQWLAATNEVGLTVGGATAQNEDIYGEADQAVRRAMGTSSPVEGARIVRRAMGRAVARMKEKRKSLRKFLADKRREEPKRNLKGPRGKRAPAEKASVAACFFDVMQATSALAAVGANINDAVKTCTGIDAIHTFKNSTPAKVCLLNALTAMGSFSGVASMLSFAASDCAVTLVPNIDALCSSTVTGTVAALSAFGGSAELMIETCKPDMEFREKYRIPVGAKASNVGQVGTAGDFQTGQANMPGLRRLGDATAEAEREADVTTSSAHSRRLLLGGGLESDQTFCFVDISTLMWFLAQAGLAINSAGNDKTLRTCPPKNIAGGNSVKGPIFRVSQALCSVSVNQAIGSFGAVATFLNMAFVHCANDLNLKALCGSGVSGVLAAMSALAGMGSGMHLSCDKFQKKPIKGAIETAHGVDNSLNGIFSTAGNVISNVLGRRLEAQKAHDDLQNVFKDAEKDVEELKKRFRTPEEAWLSIGIDLSDPDAEFRKVKPRRASPDQILELVAEEPEEGATEAKAEQGGLLDSQRVCK